MADDTSKRPGQVPRADLKDRTHRGRRRFLMKGAAAATAAAALSSLPAPAVARFGGYPRIDLPFTLGVASGDPLPHQVVIWTRLAPAPQEPGGGMPKRPVLVYWEVANDEGFRRVVRKGITFARPQYGHSVHVDVWGLKPGRTTGTASGRPANGARSGGPARRPHAGPASTASATPSPPARTTRTASTPPTITWPRKTWTW